MSLEYMYTNNLGYSTRTSNSVHQPPYVQFVPYMHSPGVNVDPIT